jgi:hypothetical protein
MNRTTHRVIDRTLAVLKPADGATPYRPAVCTTSPEEFFAFEGEAPRVLVETAKRVGLGDRQVLRKRFAFASPAKSQIERNDTVRGYWYSPLKGDVRASMVFLHAWKTTTLRSIQGLAGAAVERGCEVYIPAQPYHAWRRPRLTYSGMPFLSPDLDRTLKAMRQAVLDVRALIAWVRQREAGPLILAGVDLGGLVAALTATLQEGIDGLVIIAAHEQLSDMLWDGRADRGRFREALCRAGVDKDQVDEAWSVLDPTWRPPKVAPDKVLVVAGRFDNVCTPEGMKKLVEGLGGGRLVIHDFAHSSYMFSAQEIMEEALGLIGLGEGDTKGQELS